MKKTLGSLILIALVLPVLAQDKKAEFDRKFRFGLRVTPQPTWFVSANKKNEVPAGMVLGFGFGLNLEYHFSNIASLVTGIGADFEGGKFTYRHDDNYKAVYHMDEMGEIVKKPNSSSFGKNTVYVVNQRRIRNTYATVPLILKLSTQEYSGIKYFGMFGGELSYRVNSKARDTYHESYRLKNDTLLERTVGGESEDININPQTLFARLTFNAGLGMEYRLAGSTAAFISLNYFRSLTNIMKGEKASEYMYYTADNNGTNRYIHSKLYLTGIRINLGVMF